MIAQMLKKYKQKKLITLNKFVNLKGVTIEDIKQYSTMLSKEPKRIDFIPYDAEGVRLIKNEAIFEGWRMCKDTSAEKNKVAMLLTNGNSYKIYFMTANGVTLISLEHMVDNCTFNDLANFFQGNLELR